MQCTRKAGNTFDESQQSHQSRQYRMALRTLTALIAVATFAADHSALSQSASTIASTVPSANISDSSRLPLAKNYGNLPLSFEANQGQADTDVRFVSHGKGYTFLLTPAGATFILGKQGSNDGLPDAAATGLKTDVVRMGVVEQGEDKRSPAEISGEEKLPGTANYFIGNDPTKWRTNVPTFAKVKQAGVYPGIDLIYYGNQKQLEYDFVVQPAANPRTIQLRFKGARKLEVDHDGNLLVGTSDGKLTFRKPVVYQETNGRRGLIAGRFKLLDRESVGFEVGRYNHLKSLVIDPVLEYSTILAGTATSIATAIAVDSAGDAYVTGLAELRGFPVTSNAFQKTEVYAAAFVTKFNPTGTALIYSTYLGGSQGNNSEDRANGIAIDSQGNAYITGQTGDTDFPVTAGAFQKVSKESISGFVTKLNPKGSALVYSTYLGGSGGFPDSGKSIAVDKSGFAYITGIAESSDFPTTKGAYQTVNHGGSNAFITKLNQTGGALVYSTYLGGTEMDAGMGIVVDAAGDAYVTGQALSGDFPVTPGAFQTVNKGFKSSTNPSPAYNAFVTKINPTGSGLVYSTFLGGSNALLFGDAGNAIAVNSAGEAFVAGSAGSTDFPVTPGAFQTKNNARGSAYGSAFISKFNALGTGLLYSTFLGGHDTLYNGDFAASIAIDSLGNAYVTGVTTDTDFPTTKGAFQKADTDSLLTCAFVTKVNPTGTALLYSTYLGGSFTDQGYGIAVDSNGGTYVAGYAESSDFPTTAGAFQTSGTGAFVSKFALGTFVTPTATLTKLVSTAASQNLGSPVTFTATVSPVSGSVVPTGSVVFSVDKVVSDTVPLDSGGAASWFTSGLAAGVHTILASYGGASGFTSSNATLTETITVPQTALPAFSVPGGTYTTPETVAITDATPGAVIYYTLNGSTPSANSTKYTGAIKIALTATIDAIAIAANHSNSAIKSETYKIQYPTATPQFIPTAGIYALGQPIAITDATPSAAVYFTIDGTTPTTSSTKYTGPIALSKSETIKALALAPGFTQSIVATAAYTVAPRVPTPTIKPASGTYSGVIKVTISDALTTSTIYYTTNGQTPTLASTKYVGPFAVLSSETIKAIAVASGYAQSLVGTASYVLVLPPAVAPAFSPGPGTYDSIQTVRITSTTTGAQIYCTTDGTVPTIKSMLCNSPVSVSASETIKAIAVAPGYAQSAVSSAAYVIHLPIAGAPTFSPPGGTYFSDQNVIIKSATPGSVIHCTVDGSTPTVKSPNCSGSFTVSKSETVIAIAVASGYASSPVASADYKLQAATPSFSLVSGTYQADQTVSISCATSGVSIHYTTDGTRPTSLSPVYAAPLQVTMSETINAVAIKEGYTDSAIGSATYELKAQISVFSPPAGTYTSVTNVTIGSATANAVIYYTTDGSLPTTSSLRYSGPIMVDVTETIRAITTKTGYSNSAVNSATYNLKLVTAPPHFNPPGGAYDSAQMVTIQSSTSGSTIHCTTDGSEANAGSPICSSPVDVSISETISAIAVKTGYSDSGVVNATYEIMAKAPTFSPQAGSYPSGQLVSLSSESKGASIYYTFDGSNPTTASPLYVTGQPIPVPVSTTIRAIAVAAGLKNSTVSEAQYVIKMPFWQGTYTISTCSLPGGAVAGSGGAQNWCNEAINWPNSRSNTGTISFRTGTTEADDFRRDYDAPGYGSVCASGTATIPVQAGSFNESLLQDNYSANNAVAKNTGHWIISSSDHTTIGGTFTVTFDYSDAHGVGESNGKVTGTWKATPIMTPFPKCIPSTTPITGTAIIDPFCTPKLGGVAPSGGACPYLKVTDSAPLHEWEGLP